MLYTANVVWRPAGDVDVDQLIDLAGDEFSTVASLEDDRLHAVLTVSDATDAIDTAVRHCLGAIPGTLLSVELVTEEEQERRLAEPARPELVGLSEIAELLEVSRQRASQLRSLPAFPAPVAELRSGPVWYRSDITRFEDSWERKAGRPAAS